jgi:hypothetical protein
VEELSLGSSPISKCTLAGLDALVDKLGRRFGHGSGAWRWWRRSPWFAFLVVVNEVTGLGFLFSCSL